MNIRILMFSCYFPPEYSGSALQAISLAKKLRDRGVEVIFLTVNHDELPETDKIEGFRVYRIREGKGRFGEFLLWKNMWSLLKHQKKSFDILHSHGAYLRNSFVGPLSRLLGKKSLVKVSLAHNDLHGLGKGRSGWLHKRFFSMVDKYISISTEITSELKAHGFPDEKIMEIPNGVDTERFYPVTMNEKMALRREAGLPEKGLMLLYAGVVDERKNVKWLVEMWDKHCCEYPGFLTVVGPVSREDREMKLYNSLKTYEEKLKNKLFFIQYTDKIEDFYKMADILILPSINEGMPNVVLEAMSSGLPCLVNKVSGAEDIVKSENGMLFDTNRPETFLDELFSLKDQSTRVEMGKRARESMVRNFPLESVAEKYIYLYEKMLR